MVGTSQEANNSQISEANIPQSIMEASKDNTTDVGNLVLEDEVDSGDDVAPVPKEKKISERRQAQNVKFATWITQRTAKITKREVHAAAEDTREETLSTRALMSKQDSTKIIADPREYQLELFERAKAQNVIAVLDTGSGKTLIAVLLLKHTIDVELDDRAKGTPPRISFFLVDCVTLVFQQAAVLENNLDQKVDRFCGEMNVDFWSAETWKSIFAENMVIVCTAEILNHCLKRSFIRLDQINLLVFDEAHHAKKNHAYARLFKDHYVSEHQSKRPKIFGMTASPVDSKEDEYEAARNLEVIMHSQIVTASNLSLLRNAVSRPREVTLAYDRRQGPHETPLCLKLKEICGDLEAFAKHFANATKFASELGDWCADQIWAMALIDEEEHKMERKIRKHFERNSKRYPIAILDADLGKLADAKELVAQWSFLGPTMDGNSISDKVKNLLAYLNEEFAKKQLSRCIIFVNQRWTARLLRQLISLMCSCYIRSDLLIGTGYGDAGDMKLSFRKQLAALNKFRKGDINCLVATSIAEEGLDIPDCNLVIRFDLYTTLIQYIQSRGRARHVDSKYVHMIEDGNIAHLQLINEMRRVEKKMRSFCEALPADRLLQGYGIDFETAITKERGHRKYTDPSTGSVLTYGFSVVVLAQFVSSLPSNSEGVPKATYHVSRETQGFVCEVILPYNSPVHSATGQPHSQKVIARRSAAFEACLILRQKEYIDANFISAYRKLLPRMRNARLALAVNRSHSYTMKTKPRIWSIERGGTLPENLYVTILEVEKPENVGMPCQPLAILTRTRLPSLPAFKLNLQFDKSSNVICTSKEQSLKIDKFALDLLDSFTLRIFKDVFNKEFEPNSEEMSYWLAPVMAGWKASCTENVIDWPILQTVFENPEGIEWSKETPAEHYIDRYLVDRWDGSRRFFTLSVETNLRAHDPLPEGTAKYKLMKDMLDYSISLLGAPRHTRTWDEEQPIFRAHLLLQRINWLEEFTEEHKKVNTKAWLCIQPFLISALPISVVTMARMFPGIINRLESYLIAVEAFETLDLKAEPELALEAFTKDSDHTEEHRAQQIHVERGMGKNYERLEFIGDCFLKMATSISLFSQNPDDSEFEYHVNRMVMICNKNLLKTAIEEKLFESIRSVSFSRRDWYPQGLKLLKGKGVNKPVTKNSTHMLADKAIADVCEAIIGATLLSHNGRMDMAVKAVTFLVKSEDHSMTSWAEYYSHYKKPAYQTAESSASHHNLAMQVEQIHPYRFKYPRLLRSAFIHPSQPFATEKIPCYQRLEFLGDALLDMASVNFLFHRHPDRDPQWLTEHKMAMVSNKFLAALSVKLGFHKHLRYTSPAVEIQNREYVSELQEAEATADGARDYWTNTKQPPKTLSDIVESYVGALFVDSEFNYGEVEHFFDAHIRWFFEDISIYDTFANNHPTTYLHNLLAQTFGCTEYRLMGDEIAPVFPGAQPTSVAALLIHDEIVAEGEAGSIKQAKVKASSAALALLQGMKVEEYRVVYGCFCQQQQNKD